MKQLLALGLVLMLLTGCGAPPMQTVRIFAMDTVMELSVCTEQEELPAQAEALLHELDHALSATDPGSEIYALNLRGHGNLSPLTAQLLEQALDCAAQTNGALALSVYPAMELWGFPSGEYHIPTEAELSRLRPLVDDGRIRFSPETGAVALHEGMKLDLGSVAKGFAGDQVLSLLAQQGVTSALLNLGGNVQALGTKPDGSPWRVGIRDPNSTDILGILSLSGGAAITSGGYERWFEGPDGTRYHHILDPKELRPARSGLVSVTVVGPQGLRCDALSTALFVMGEAEAISFWQAHRDFEMLLVNEAGELLLTPGLESVFEPAPDCPYARRVLDEP